jgi:predicted deacylase
MLSIAGMEVAAGSIAYGSIPFEGQDIPVVAVSGSSGGPILAVVGLQHTDEFSGPGVLDAFLESGVPAGLCGSVVILPIANPFNYSASLDRADLGVPAGQRGHHPAGVDANLNRQWPGDPSSANRISRVAATLWNRVIARADALIDFHCCRPSDPWFAACLEGHQPSLALALAMRLDAVDVQSASSYAPGLLFMEAASELDLPAVLVESSPAGFQPRHSIDICEKGLLRAMVHLGMLPAMPPARPRRPQAPAVFVRSDPPVELKVAQGGYLGVRRWPGETVSRGDCIGEVRSVRSFEVVERLISPIDGAVACIGDPEKSGFVRQGVLAAVLKPVHPAVHPAARPA